MCVCVSEREGRGGMHVMQCGNNGRSTAITLHTHALKLFIPQSCATIDNTHTHTHTGRQEEKQGQVDRVLAVVLLVLQATTAGWGDGPGNIQLSRWLHGFGDKGCVLVSFPGLPRLQFCIACSILETGKAWERSYCG